MNSRHHNSKPWAANVDLYRKIPTDLMEGSRQGSIFSYIALALMIILFVAETSDFLGGKLETYLAMDVSGEDKRIRLNFNITMMDLKCDWAVIDIVSALGNTQNVSAHVTKWNVDGSGIRVGYRGRNRNQKDIDLYDSTVSETLEELHENGEDAISLDADSLALYKKEHDYVFVDFYASWCSHCRDLAPTWETLAEVMVDAGEALGNEIPHPDDYSEADYLRAKRMQMPVVIAKIDCVSHPKVCNEQELIRAYPTLRLFVDGEPWKAGDYRGHRTITDMVEWLYYAEEQHKELLDGGTESVRTLHEAHGAARERLDDHLKEKEDKRWNNRHMDGKRRLHHDWVDEEHPGCQLVGHLLLDRVPGNFHILARSGSHDLAPHMTNVSHQVNSLTVGDPMAVHRVETSYIKNLPEKLTGKIAPMDGNVYVTENLHEAYHHYLKVVPTQVDGLQIGARFLRAYQILPNSQLAYYRTDMVPEAKFVYDLSPIKVFYRKPNRRWYDYCTSIMAIVGGVFTVVGMLESSVEATVKASRR
eukprot:CAMPEP_0113630938 /NCGR_PEP_ID=MMETSP0017_2-20120614/16078_1 /TAXON_ID=2856 /ORGANISM="Cylindrotheca closterium" /LENGTH=530 /DNA_ID=CAMNT_0000541429 /DNA_START=223 /DNA_END=1812 /DNA_ORIENTATION=- /assembly_acc=CAM_ASM_000147